MGTGGDGLSAGDKSGRCSPLGRGSARPLAWASTYINCDTLLLKRLEPHDFNREKKTGELSNVQKIHKFTPSTKCTLFHWNYCISLNNLSANCANLFQGRSCIHGTLCIIQTHSYALCCPSRFGGSLLCSVMKLCSMHNTSLSDADVIIAGHIVPLCLFKQRGRMNSICQ